MRSSTRATSASMLAVAFCVAILASGIMMPSDGSSTMCNFTCVPPDAVFDSVHSVSIRFNGPRRQMRRELKRTGSTHSNGCSSYSTSKPAILVVMRWRAELPESEAARARWSSRSRRGLAENHCERQAN